VLRWQFQCDKSVEISTIELQVNQMGKKIHPTIAPDEDAFNIFTDGSSRAESARRHWGNHCDG